MINKQVKILQLCSIKRIELVFQILKIKFRNYHKPNKKYKIKLINLHLILES